MPLRSKNKTKKRRPVKINAVLPDLLYVLERRRRTVETFLAERNVTTKEELKRLVVDLRKEYNISPEFLKQAHNLVQQNVPAKQLLTPSDDTTANKPKNKKSPKPFEPLE